MKTKNLLNRSLRLLPNCVQNLLEFRVQRLDGVLDALRYWLRVDVQSHQDILVPHLGLDIFWSALALTQCSKTAA